MEREDIAIAIMWGISIIAIVATLVSSVYMVVSALGDVLAATLGAAGTLAAAILSHALTDIREQRLVRQERMQSNYSSLIVNIGELIRNPNLPTDEFSTVHLSSWVVGSPEVIRATQHLLTAQNRRCRRTALEELLAAMRVDLGQLTPVGLTLDHVFPQMNKEYLSE